jgi:hypothetical protein
VLSCEEAHRTFADALQEFAPDWEPLGDFRELTARDPDNWTSGMATFGTTVRHRMTGRLKVLGRRRGTERDATYHRGVSFLVLEAYRQRTTDPIRRYIEEVGLAALRPVWGPVTFRAG